MSGEAAKFTVFPGGQPAHVGEAPGQRYQELWFAIARQPWASLVLVPADVGVSVAPVAKALADVATRLSEAPVSAIVAESIDYAAARSLSEIQPRLRGDVEPRCLQEVETTSSPAIDRPSGGYGPPREARPLARAIVAIRPVVSDPLGIAIVHAADAAVLCVEMGTSRAAAARRTIELIGAERIIGAFLLR
jgi:hypothetical protein